MEPSDADTLALTFIDRLRMAARGDEEKSFAECEFTGFLDVFEDPQVRTPPALKADVVGAAILLARACEPAEGLVEALAMEDPVVVIPVPSAAWVEPMRTAVKACLLASIPAQRPGPAIGGRRPHARPEALIVGRDGSSTMQRPDRGNETVGDAINEGRAVIGIAPDIHRLLPSDLVRAAEHHLDVGSLDSDAIALVIEAVTGARPARNLAPSVASTSDAADLRLAVQASRGADRCLDRLEALVRRKTGSVVAAGPGLEEIVGFGEAREWGLALVDDLRRWKAGEIAFRDCSSALLLSGPPGTGKTKFASAVAASTGLPLHIGSLGRWQAHRDGHLGHTLSALQGYFEIARREPCIALIDEIDSFGNRAEFSSSHRDYSSQVVNALLEQLDGAVAREGVIVIATTNHPDRIDPAILRSGRLDRHVRIGMPTVDELVGILRGYLRADLGDCDLRPVAVKMRGMTGADVEAVVRRARGAARRRPGSALSVDDLVAAIVEEAPAMSTATRMRAAVHEAGHGLVSIRVGGAQSVVLSVQAVGGLTATITDEPTGVGEQEIESRIVMLLAGRAAEELLLGEVSAGAATDLEMATQLAAMMECRWGFSAERPLISMGRADQIDIARMPWLMRPIQERLARCYEQALDLLRAERPAVERLAAALLRTGYLDDIEVRKLIAAPDRSTSSAAEASCVL